MPLPPLNPLLGKQVSTRSFSLLEMVERAWGSEFSAPDHGVYTFSNGRRFDSTDMGITGIYRRGVYVPPEMFYGLETDYGAGILTDSGAPIYPDTPGNQIETDDGNSLLTDAGAPITQD